MEVRLKYEVQEPFDRELMKVRGIEDIRKFLYPTKNELQEPINLDGVEKGKQLLTKMAGEKALLLVDSDADGYCSASILFQYLRDVWPEWEIEVVLHEGKQHGVEGLVDRYDLNAYSLVLIPDAGSNDDEYFQQYPSTEFLVIDHHIREIEGEEPGNVTIINNQTSPSYKNKNLSGGGVTWQFCRYLDQTSSTQYAEKYIDLAAVSIISDIMDTTQLENRYIIDRGLKIIKNDFLGALVDSASFQLGSGDLTPMGLAFYVIPNINAMCRMGSMPEKERMWRAFVSPEELVESQKRGVVAGTMVPVVEEAVRESRNVKARQKRQQEKMAELCEKSILESDLLTNKILTIVLNEDFDGMPTELNGLTATKVSKDTGHPTLIGRVNKEGDLKGSIRGLETVDMPPFKDFLESSGLFHFVQGHQLAAGFSLPYKNLSKFHDWANEQLKDVDLASQVWQVDFSFDALSESDSLAQVIKDMERIKHLWGHGFPEPLVHVENIVVKRGDVQVMGKKTNTVKVTYDGVAYMFFRRSMKEVADLIEHGQMRLEVVGRPNLNVYYNSITPQIFVSDYTIQGMDLEF